MESQNESRQSRAHTLNWKLRPKKDKQYQKHKNNTLWKKQLNLRKIYHANVHIQYWGGHSTKMHLLPE